MTKVNEDQFLLPVRMLNEYVYCPRLFYYEMVEKEFEDSADTIQGDFIHRNVDRETGILPNPDEKEKIMEETKLVARSVLLSSKNQGLISRMDIVEGDSNEVWPVEYKKGQSNDKDQVWLNDSIQLCAQALILRENGYRCNEGYIYYQGSHRRVKIDITDDLIETTLKMAKSAKDLLNSNAIPDPLNDSNKCERCSLSAICLPDETLFLRSQDISKNKGEIRMLYPARDDTLPLYIQEQGAKISKKDEELIVKLEGEIVSRIKLIDISSLSLFGNVQITTQTVHELLRRGIPIAYFSTGAWLLGFSTGMPHKNIELRIKQYSIHADPSYSMRVARSFIFGKIRNSRTLLRRNAKNDVSYALKKLSDLSRAAMNAKDSNELLGVEGFAARIYFQHFRDMIKSPIIKGLFDFNSRNRRPPKDPINALLSFNYALLARDMSTILIKVGFDPYLGFFHNYKYGSPALALDMMEEFRPIIADSTVINLLNNGEINDSDFISRGGAVALNSSGKKKTIKAYERRMDVLITHPIFGYSISYRRILEVQARLLTRWVNGEIKEYPVFLVR